LIDKTTVIILIIKYIIDLIYREFKNRPPPGAHKKVTSICFCFPLQRKQCISRKLPKVNFRRKSHP